MAEPTKLPWRFDHDWHRLPTIFGADGYKLAIVEKDRLDEAKANAARIIKAVNNHETLVKALSEIDTLATCTGVVNSSEHRNMLDNIYRIARGAMNAVVGRSGP